MVVDGSDDWLASFFFLNINKSFANNLYQTVFISKLILIVILKYTSLNTICILKNPFSLKVFAFCQRHSPKIKLNMLKFYQECCILVMLVRGVENRTENQTEPIKKFVYFLFGLVWISIRIISKTISIS